MNDKWIQVYKALIKRMPVNKRLCRESLWWLEEDLDMYIRLDAELILMELIDINESEL